MSSSTLENLRETLRNIRRRRSRLNVLRQASIAVIAIVGFALLLSLVEAWLDPSRTISILLFGILVAGSIAIAVASALQLRRARSDDHYLAHYVEDRIPDLEQRLLTSLEFHSDDESDGRKGVSRQFVRQLWLDAEAHVQEQQQRVESVASLRTSWWALGSACATVAVAVVALLLSDALLTGATRLLWPFSEEAAPPVAVIEAPAPISISVEPGDIAMQRGNAATIVARVTNAMPTEIQLRLQTDNVNWQELTMRQEGSGSDSATYSYFLPSVQENTTYYVNFVHNGEQRSEQFRISLYDLPQVEQIDVAYRYPEYTGITNDAEEDAGDMVVPEGTQVDLLVTFNKNVESATIEFEENESGYQALPLTIEGNTGRATLTIAGDGIYRVTARDFERLVSENPLDYYIRAIPDQPPELALLSPGRDQDVMPLEEVVLQVEASDDYGLSQFELHYNVVGAEAVAVDFLPEEQTRSIAGNELLYLEDMGVAPGDFVSYYLTLADNNGLTGPAAVVSDIYFLQVIPTDQEFRRANGGGGGGGGGAQGGESSALVTLQKDIIAATWKLRNQVDPDPATFATDVQIIAESQGEATGRARQSIDRLAERLNFSDDSYDNAVMNLQQAIEHMNVAIGELQKQQVTSALTPQQMALQFILKAEADINRTNVSTQQAGGGGGGGAAQQEREDLRELFEMEMGQMENRYETPQRGGGGSARNSEEANKLEELARRQEGLTRAQRDLARRMEQMNEEQRRRELERLQREQEQLSQEVAQLSRQMSRGQQGQQGQQNQQNQQGQQQGQSQQASSSAGGQAAGAQNSLEQVAQQMQDAAQAESPAQAAARSQRALENLREQQRQLNQEQNSSVQQLAENVRQRGQQLVQEQRQLQQDLQAANREQGLGQNRQSTRDSEQLQQLLATQQQQRREIEEIEKMLRAIIARGENEDQQLLNQAQRASRSIRPVRETMDTSSRVLRNGMVNLAVDLEQEVGDDLAELEASLQAMTSGGRPAATDPVQQAARDATELMEQMQALQRGAEARNSGEVDVPLAQMREQLARSQQLAEQLSRQLQQQQQEQRMSQRGQPGSQGQQAGQQQTDQTQPGQQIAQAGQQGQPGQGPQGNGQQGQDGQQGQAPGQQGQGQQGQGGQGNQQASSSPGQQGGQQGAQQGAQQGGQRGQGGDGRPGTGGGSNALGNARTIRSELTRQGIEDFLSQPELFTALLQPIIELEAELRAQAEMDRINQKIYASADEDVPDQYRRLVEEYYRVLSETNGAGSAAPEQ